MRLVTFAVDGVARAGVVLDETNVIDLHGADPLLPSDLRALVGSPGLLDHAREVLERIAAGSRGGSGSAGGAGPIHDLSSPGVRLLAPIPNPSKMMAIGLNYRAHAAETNQAVPQRPIVFAKFANTIVGVGDEVKVPKASTRVDWEGELCVVIGVGGRHISTDTALEHVAGYMNGNDISVRDWQSHAATWTMGKNFDTHGPMGPWILTADEAPDPSAFTLRTYVNGSLKQESGTDDLIFSVPELIAYLSTAMTLEPGDVIFTGTPSGVGTARNPREWLQPGDTVCVEISGLGVLENRVVDE